MSELIANRYPVQMAAGHAIWVVPVDERVLGMDSCGCQFGCKGRLVEQLYGGEVLRVTFDHGPLIPAVAAYRRMGAMWTPLEFEDYQALCEPKAEDN